MVQVGENKNIEGFSNGMGNKIERNLSNTKTMPHIP
jgi:hypothetical protein